MKKFSFVILILFTSFLTQLNLKAQSSDGGIAIIFQNNFGYTIIDVPKAVDFPESPALGTSVDDWENFNYNGIVQLLFNSNASFSYGIEAGMNRLYYWLERYQAFGQSTPYFTSHVVWTFHAGGIIRVRLSQEFYFLTGVSAHIFLDDSGTTAGVPVALGYDFPVSDAVTIPIEFRTDVIFGNETPIGVGGGIGLKINLSK